MKKISFIIFFFCIILLFLRIIEKKEITNKVIKMNDELYQVEVNYPLYKINDLDQYTRNVVLKYINDFKHATKSKYNSNLYIDYDIKEMGNKVNTTFYIYIIVEGILKEENLNLVYDIKSQNITSNNNLEKVDYDFANSKTVDKNTKLVAFTFDDGPSYNTNKIIKTLKKYNSTATFFVMGNKINKYESTLLKLKNSGMEIGNHTYTHKLLSRLSEEEIMLEINDTQEEVYRVCNIYPTLFRPSYGTVSRKIKNISPLPLIIWNLDTLDWKYHNSKRIVNKIIKNVSDGDIILMHDTYSATANAVELVIPKLNELGYQVVSVSELFYYKNIIPTTGKYYGSIK